MLRQDHAKEAGRVVQCVGLSFGLALLAIRGIVTPMALAS
jgi:hypothetical protein